MIAWVQSTQIGLDAFVDDRNLTGSHLSGDGSPDGGVELSIAPPRVITGHHTF